MNAQMHKVIRCARERRYRMHLNAQLVTLCRPPVLYCGARAFKQPSPYTYTIQLEAVWCGGKERILPLGRSREVPD